MARRERLDAGGGNYFSGRKEKLEFISTGSTLLDLALGGGWAERRIANVVGDKCLSGDTIVSVCCRGSRPSKMTIATLYKRVNGDHPNRNTDAETRLLVDLGGYVGLHTMVSVQKTGTKTLYRVTVDDGQSIDVSKYHKFKTVMGWKTIEKGLEIGSKIYCWRGKHHVDGDPTNDSFDNLELLPSLKHWSEHADDMRRDTNRTVVREVKSIEPLAAAPTYDITMESPHNNFVANGFVVHNSTGKTLQCIEATANFAIKYPKGKIRYREAESAFDKLYAQALGMPIDRIDFGSKRIATVEDLFEDLTKICEKAKAPEFVVVDSLDALSDRSELDRDIDEGSYGANKAKKMSEMFRRLTQTMSDKNVTLLIVSQVRDKIGAMFGAKHTRTGGRAMDFYASQVLMLAHLGRIVKTTRGLKRATGVKILAKCDKNKISLPFREAEFNIHFGYGTDDAQSMINWLKQTKGFKAKNYGLTDDEAKFALKTLLDMSRREEREIMDMLREDVTARWYEIEKDLMPKRSKYA